MPRLPELQQSPMDIAPPQTNISGAGAGLVGQAYQNLGQAVQRAGIVGMQLMAAREDSEDKSWSTYQRNKDFLEVDDLVTKTKDKFEQGIAQNGPDHAPSLVNDIRSKIEEKKKFAQKESPSGQAAEYYNLATQAEFDKALSDYNSFEYKTRGIQRQNAIQSQGDQIAKRAFDKADPLWAKTELDKFLVLMKANSGIGETAEDYSKREEKIKNSFAVRSADGIIKKGNYYTGKAALKKEDSVFQYLTPEQYEKFKINLDEGIKSKQEVKKSVVNASIDRFEKVSKTSAPSEDARADVMRQALNSGKDPVSIVDDAYRINTLYSVGKEAESLKRKKTEEVINFSPDVTKMVEEMMAKEGLPQEARNSPQMSVIREKYRIEAQRMAKDIVKNDLKQREDSTQYLLDRDPEIQRLYTYAQQDPSRMSEFALVLRGKQQELGLRTQLLPDEKLQGIAALFDSGVDEKGEKMSAAEKSIIVDSIQAQYGDATPSVFSDMYQKGYLKGANAQLVHAVYFEDPVSRKAVIQNMSNKTLAIRWDKMSDGEKHDFNMGITEEVDNHLVALARSGDTGISQALHDLVKFSALDQMSRGFTQSESIKTAVSLVNKEYSAVKGSRSVVIHPGRVSQDKVKAFLRVNEAGGIDAIYEKKQFLIPPAYPTVERYIEDLKSRSFWANDGDGLTMFRLNQDNSTSFIKDASGAKIHYSWDEIESNQELTTQKIAPKEGYKPYL